MHQKRRSFALTAILLLILSVGIAYDPCAQKDFDISLSEVSVSGPSSDVSPSQDGLDCHCLCHFSFSLEPMLEFGPSEPIQALVSPLKKSSEEPFISAVLRPPKPSV